MNVTIKCDPELKPFYASAGAAGFDIYAGEDAYVAGHRTELVKTGLYVEVPEGFELQIRPRSGMVINHELSVILGTVDSDYRGEVGIIVYNLDKLGTIIHKGDRIAQGVIAPVVQANFIVVDELTPTKRGAGGFGSTGER